MANHKSSIKRIRQDKKKALHNKYYAKTQCCPQVAQHV